MNELFFEAISDDVARKNLNIAKDEEIEYRCIDKIGRTEVTFLFTDKDKACWVAKYKGEIYGQSVTNIEKQDKYTLLDVFKTLRENATKTLKEIK